MDRKERFNNAYEYIRSKGLAHTQEEVALKMGSTASNVSKAMKGESRVLTDNFLRRFNGAFDGIFNLEWLILGEGERLKECNEQDAEPVTKDQTVLRLIDELSAQRMMTERELGKKNEQIDRLLSLLEKETERTNTIIRQNVG